MNHIPSLQSLYTAIAEVLLKGGSSDIVESSIWQQGYRGRTALQEETRAGMENSVSEGGT